jgi:hypothetical protein
MAGGMQALLQSVEGAEDSESKGAEAIAHAEVSSTRRCCSRRCEQYDAVHCRSPAFRRARGALRDCGFDPDNPPNLTKITETL